MNIWNVYRNRWVCKFLEYHGVPVIPTVLWADKNTYDFVFNSLPKSSTLALSIVGTYKKEDRKLFVDGFYETLKRLEPERLIIYGEFMLLDFKKYCDSVAYYKSDWQKKRELM